MIKPERHNFDFQKKRILIYAILCPETKKIMYIGKTCLSLRRRLGLHLNKAKMKPNSKKNFWILGLKIPPEICLIENTTVLMANEREKYWICKYNTTSLLNGNAGGGGNNESGIKRNSAYLSKFKVFLQKSSYSKSTARNYYKSALLLINYFHLEDKSPKEINQKDIANFINSISNLNTQKVIISGLKVFYSEIMGQKNKLSKVKYEYS